MMHRTRLMALGLVLVLLAACTTDADRTSSEATAATQAAAEFATTTVAFSDETDREAPESETLGSGGTGEGVLVANDFGRDIIFTADITVAVADVASAGDQATAAVQSLGGFLFGQQTIGGGEARSTLIFKIAPENFQAALAALGDLGEVRTQNVSADDVTDVVVDLESRITTAEASVERLRTLLENAGDIDTIADIESQLLQRETTLETLRGQLRTLRDAVSLATITLNLTEALSNPSMEVQVSAYPGTDDSGASCPGDGGVGVLEGETVTVCFEIFNTGDTLLTGFTLRDAVLDVEFDDLLVVWGDPEANLEPGQSLVLATQVQLDRSLRTQGRFTAVPVNEEGQRVEAREVARTTAIFLTAEDPGGLPGFGEGLDTSWQFLQDLGGLVVLAAGLIVPFLWVLLIFLAFRWWRGRRVSETEPKPQEESVDA